MPDQTTPGPADPGRYGRHLSEVRGRVKAAPPRDRSVLTNRRLGISREEALAAPSPVEGESPNNSKSRQALGDRGPRPLALFYGERHLTRLREQIGALYVTPNPSSEYVRMNCHWCAAEAAPAVEDTDAEVGRDEAIEVVAAALATPLGLSLDGDGDRLRALAEDCVYALGGRLAAPRGVQDTEALAKLRAWVDDAKFMDPLSGQTDVAIVDYETLVEEIDRLAAVSHGETEREEGCESDFNLVPCARVRGHSGNHRNADWEWNDEMAVPVAIGQQVTIGNVWHCQHGYWIGEPGRDDAECGRAGCDGRAMRGPLVLSVREVDINQPAPATTNEEG